MPRYALRNQQKIQETYSKKLLERITRSLDKHFQNHATIELEPESDHPKYKILVIDDIDHSFNIIAFYVISQTYDVFNIAFKEFIG